MEDIIDIIVTETTNTIEITAQPNDEIIDVNIIDNREDIVLNVTPTVVEININSLTSNFGVEWGDITGTLANQTDLNNALALKANLVGGKVPASELPSYVDDVVEVATFSALPATGEIGKIYVILDTNKIYRWSGSTYIEIADSTAVWGAITGTLSSQTDLQNALNAKFDDPTGDTTQYIAGDGSLITFPVAGQSGTLVREVRNTTGATLTKGTIVYISGATGNKPTVSKAIATGDSTSAQTFGMCQSNIANNSNGYVVCVGDITGLDTSAVSEGVQLYLSSTTAGEYTTTKQLAPAHLVYIGVVTRSHPTLGQIEVKIQNGYELDEIHDVAISSLTNNDGLFYESSTDLWKNKSIATVLGYTPANDSLVVKLAGAQTITGLKTFSGGLIANVSTGGDQGFASTNTSSSATSVFVQNNSTGIGILANNALGGDAILIGNDTSGRGIYITNATISGGGKGISIDNYNSGIGIEVGSDSSADAIKVLHLAGRAFNIQSSGGGYGVIINNTTASTSAPFTIQKQGASVITLTDAGAGTFNSSLTASSFIRTSGTSSQFLKADGSVDSSVYALDSAVVKLTGTQTIAGVKTFSSQPVFGNTVMLQNTASGTVLFGGYTTIWTTDSAFTALVGTASSTTIGFSLLYDSSAQRSYTMPTANGTLALTSQLSSYLPLSGGTLTGALSGTSATFSNASGVPSLNLRSSNTSFALMSLLGNQTGDVNWLLMSGYPNAGDFTIRQSDTVDALVIKKTTGAATFSSSVQTTNLFVGTTGTATSLNSIQSPYGILSGLIEANVAGNAYYNSGWKYYGNGPTGVFNIDTSGNFGFYTAGSGVGGNNISLGNAKVTFTNAGNVGIGTTAPGVPLDVVSNSNANALTIRARLSNDYGLIDFKSNNASEVISEVYIHRTATNTGSLIFSTNNGSASPTERMRITSSGNVLIGSTANTGDKFQVYGAVCSFGADAILYVQARDLSNSFGFYGNTQYNMNVYSSTYGTVGNFNMTTGIYTPTSDKNKKKDFEDSNIGLNEVMQLKPTLYRMKVDSETSEKHLGFIAQEVQGIIPSAYQESDGFIGLNFNPIVAALTKAVQELKAELDTLKNIQ